MNLENNYKQLFRDKLLEVQRNGIDKLYQWLDTKTDFFEAPASTIYHNNKVGGLCEHSYNVFLTSECLCNYIKELKNIDIPYESIIITGLLHDICKVNSYKDSYRNFKDEETGQWLKYKTYEKLEDPFPYGHGEKSVWMIQQFIKLTPLEMLAIRHHMGLIYTSEGEERRTITNAFNKHPLIVITHLADMLTSYSIDEIVDYKKIAKDMIAPNNLI